MKPDWKDAPEWANYLAQDNSGAWFWYEGEPYNDGKYCWWSSGRDVLAVTSPHWLQTLEKRPSEIPAYQTD